MAEDIQPEPTENEEFFDVFISYSRIDLDRAREVVTALEEQKLNVWIDFDDIPKGANWRNEIERGIDACHSFLFLISENSVVSEECRKEIEIATQKKKRFVPVLYREIGDHIYRTMHSTVGAHNWIFGRPTDNWDGMMDEIIKTINTDLDHVRAHTRWNVRARRWEYNEKKPDFLISGAELRDAETWLQHATDKQPEPTSLHIEFISRSQIAVLRRWRIVFSSIVVTTIFLAILAVTSFALFRRSESLQKSLQIVFTQVRSLALSNSLELGFPDQVQRIALSMEATSIDDLPLQSWQSLATNAYVPGPTAYAQHYEVAITDIAVAPDQLEIAAVDLDGNIIFLDAQTLDIVREFQIGADYEFYTVAYKPNGLEVWVAGCNVFDDQPVPGCDIADIFVIDPSTGEQLAQLSQHTNDVRALTFSPDGTKVLTGAHDGRLNVWKADTYELEAALVDASIRSNIWDVDYLSSGNTAIVSLQDGTFVLWDLIDQVPIFRSNWDDTDSPILATDTTSNELFAVIGTQLGSLYVWDILSQTVTEFVPNAHADTIAEVAITDDERIISTSWDGTAKVWQLIEGSLREVHELSGNQSRVNALALNIDGDIAYGGGENGTLIRWDLMQGDIVSQFSGHNDWVWDLALSDNDEHLLSTSSDDTILMWDWRNQSIEQQFIGHTGNVRQALFHPNQAQILSVSEDGTLRLWDVETGEAVREYVGAENIRYFSAAFNADGSAFLAGADDGTVTLWSTETGEIRRTFADHTSIARAVSYLPNENQFISASYDGTLRLWDVATGEVLQVFDAHNGRVVSFAIHPDGNRMVSAADDNTLIHWNIAENIVLDRFIGHYDYAVDVAFNIDGTLLASAGWDGQIILWDVDTAAVRYIYDGHDGNVSSILFTGDSQNLISMGPEPFMGVASTAQFFVWRVDTVETLRNWTLANRYVRSLTCNEQALFGIPLSDSCS